VRSLFLYKLLEFINDKRMELFQSMFYNLYEKYDRDSEKFIEDWFEKYTYITLRRFFKEDFFKEDLDLFFQKNKNVLKSYVKAYWAFCNNPNSKPYYVKEAMDYFCLEELNMKELKKVYREMVKKYHPDVYPDKKEGTIKMIEINHYYQILKTYIEKLGG
jgi:hypothetical protein